MHLLGISGSLRAGSFNSRLLAAAGDHVPDGSELLGVLIGLRDIPPFDADAEEPAPAAVAAFREALEAADAVLISTPEYNSSIPGQLKNALDWASRPFATNALRNRPVVVIGQHEPVRRHLGRGRAAQGARSHRCPRRRHGARHPGRPRGVPTSTAASPTPSSMPASARSSRRSPGRRRRVPLPAPPHRRPSPSERTGAARLPTGRVAPRARATTSDSAPRSAGTPLAPFGRRSSPPSCPCLSERRGR